MLSYPLKRWSENGTRSSLLSFNWLFLLILFMLPYGKLQNIALGGMTLPKLMFPLCSLFQIVWLGRHYKFHPHLPIYITFVLLTTPSFAIGVEEYSSIFVSLLGYAVLFQFCYNAHIRIAHLEKMIKAYMAGLATMALIVVAAFFGTDLGALFGKSLVEWWYGTPVFLGGEQNPNAFAAYFISGLTAVAVQMALAQNKLRMAIYTCLYVFLLAVLVMTFSRSAILGAVVGTVVVYLCAKRRTILGVVKAVSIFLLVSYIVYASVGFVSGMLTDNAGEVSVFGNKETSAGYRLIMLDTAFSAFSLADIFGIGYGNYSKIIEPVIGESINAHNIFVGIGLEFGFLSLLLFVLLTILTISVYIRALRRSSDVKVQVIVGFYIGSLFGLMVHGLFHEIYINLLYWFMVANALPVYKAVMATKVTNFARKRVAV